MKYSTAMEWVDSFRLFADFLEEHSDALPKEFRVEISSWCSKAWHDDAKDPKEVIAHAIAATLKGGGKVGKEYDDWGFSAQLKFGLLNYEVRTMRSNVCTKVVVGTETVEEEEREGEDKRPFVMVKREKDITKWECDPILEALTKEPANG